MTRHPPPTAGYVARSPWLYLANGVQVPVIGRTRRSVTVETRTGPVRLRRARLERDGSDTTVDGVTVSVYRPDHPRDGPRGDAQPDPDDQTMHTENANERAALLRNREQAERLTTPRRTVMDTSTAAFERLAERQIREQQARTGGVDALNRHHEQHGRLLTGHEPAAKQQRDKLEATARSFTYNRQMERLLEWEAKGDPRLDKIDPSQRISMGFYRRSKDAARKLGLPTGKPTDDGNGW